MSVVIPRTDSDGLHAQQVFEDYLERRGVVSSSAAVCHLIEGAAKLLYELATKRAVLSKNISLDAQLLQHFSGTLRHLKANRTSRRLPADVSWDDLEAKDQTQLITTTMGLLGPQFAGTIRELKLREPDIWHSYTKHEQIVCDRDGLITFPESFYLGQTYALGLDLYCTDSATICSQAAVELVRRTLSIAIEHVGLGATSHPDDDARGSAAPG